MRTKIILCVITLCFALVHFNASAQYSSPSKQWDKDFGGSDIEELYAMQQTNDGGYVLGGWSKSGISGDKTEDSRGDNDYWIVKTDSTGAKQWNKRYGGSSSDQLSSIQHTTDGGYILGGTSSSGISGDKSEACLGIYDYWIIKTDANGIKQWDKDFGGTDRNAFTSLQQTTDGGYILGGSSLSGAGGNKTSEGFGSYDYWVIKIDSNGNKEWEKSFGGTMDDELTCLQQTSDGGYILGGFTNSGISGNKTEDSRGHYDYWIVKITDQGNIQWDRDFSGLVYDYLFAVKQTTDGGYILGGSSLSDIGGDKTEPNKNNLGNDFWIIKTDANGIKQWDKDYGGSGDDGFAALCQTSDGGYLFGGSSTSGISGDKSENTKSTNYDYWVIKTDTAGAKQWDKDYGGSIDQHLISVKETNDLGYILGGFSESNASGDKTQNTQGSIDYWIVKMNMDAILPVSLLNFNAVEKDKQVLLSWQSISGNANGSFNIQRSVDGNTFTTIGKVYTKPKINGITIYSYTDDISACNSKKLYYHIQAVDEDGKSIYSNIQVINNAATSFIISPNPAQNFINVSGQNLQQIQLYNMQGKLIISKDASSSSTNRIDVSHLSAGIYVVKLVDTKGNHQTIQLIIQ